MEIQRDETDNTAETQTQGHTHTDRDTEAQRPRVLERDTAASFH